MKKVLILLLATVLSLGLCCGCSEEGTAGATDVATMPVEEVPDYIISLMEDVDSVRIRETMEMSINLNGKSMAMSGEAVCEVSESQGMAHVDSKVSNMGIEINAEMYVEKKGNQADLYMSIGNGGNWGNMTVPVSTLEAQNGYHENMMEFSIYLSALTNVERTAVTHNGKDAYLIKGQVDYNKIVDFVMEAGFADAVAQGSAEMESKIKEIYKDLDPIEVAVYVDASSGLPLQIEADPTAMFNSFYANASDGKMPMSLDKAYIMITFEDYNNVSIEIPAEAKN